MMGFNGWMMGTFPVWGDEHPAIPPILLRTEGYQAFGLIITQHESVQNAGSIWRKHPPSNGDKWVEFIDFEQKHSSIFNFKSYFWSHFWHFSALGSSGPSVSCCLDPSVAQGSEWAKPGSSGFWDPVPGLQIRGLRVAVCRWGQWIHSDPKSKYFNNGAQSSPRFRRFPPVISSIGVQQEQRQASGRWDEKWGIFGVGKWLPCPVQSLSKVDPVRPTSAIIPTAVTPCRAEK